MQVDCAHVGLCVEPKGRDPAIRHATDQRLNLGVVGTTDGQTVERDVGHEIKKALTQVFDRAPVLHMLGVDVRDDGDGGGQSVKGAVAFIGLDDHPLALTHAGVGAIGVNDAAVDHGRVDPARIQKGCNHRGRGGFAMGARNRDIRFQAHQLGQHFGAAHNRHARGARGVQFGVTRFDGAGNHDDLGPV